MAAAIIPKSKIRQIENVSVGYGQVPVVEQEGLKGWGLPGRGITFCIEEAKAVAQALDNMIRENLGHPARPTLL